MKISGSSPSFTLTPLDKILEQLVGPLEAFEVVSECEHDLAENLPVVKDVLASYDLHLTVHAPFSDLNLASVIPAMRKASVKRTLDTLPGVVEIGANIITIHPGYSSPIANYDRSIIPDALRTSLAEIAPVAQDLGLTLCLENMPKQKILVGYEMEDFYDMWDNADVAITFDLGHAHTAGQLEKFKFLKSNFEHVHIHDNMGERDIHLPLGEGNAPLQDTIEWLRSNKDGPAYDATMVIEANNVEELLKSHRTLTEWLK